MDWRGTRNGNYQADQGHYVVFQFRRGPGWGCMVGGEVRDWTRYPTAEAAMAALEDNPSQRPYQERHRVHSATAEPWAGRIRAMRADLERRKRAAVNNEGETND
jgi:hypothetical protein